MKFDPKVEWTNFLNDMYVEFNLIEEDEHDEPVVDCVDYFMEPM